MTLIFDDMLHKQVEDYVDDLVVKAKNPVEGVQLENEPFQVCLRGVLRKVLRIPYPSERD